MDDERVILQTVLTQCPAATSSLVVEGTGSFAVFGTQVSWEL